MGFQETPNRPFSTITIRLANLKVTSGYGENSRTF